jgi:hypothetical protein
MGRGQRRTRKTTLRSEGRSALKKDLTEPTLLEMSGLATQPGGTSQVFHGGATFNASLDSLSVGRVSTLEHKSVLHKPLFALELLYSFSANFPNRPMNLVYGYVFHPLLMLGYDSRSYFCDPNSERFHGLDSGKCPLPIISDCELFAKSNDIRPCVETTRGTFHSL